MNNPDPNFTTTISVDQSPEVAFAAITNPRGWWSENIEGSTANFGDVWKYHYKDAHRCTMKVIEAVPNKKVVWLVVDNYFNFTEDKTECRRNSCRPSEEIVDAGQTNQTKSIRKD